MNQICLFGLWEHSSIESEHGFQNHIWKWRFSPFGLGHEQSFFKSPEPDHPLINAYIGIKNLQEYDITYRHYHHWKHKAPIPIQPYWGENQPILLKWLICDLGWEVNCHNQPQSSIVKNQYLMTHLVLLVKFRQRKLVFNQCESVVIHFKSWNNILRKIENPTIPQNRLLISGLKMKI